MSEPIAHLDLGAELQAAAATLDTARPLLVFDVDEVLCPSAQQFRHLLSERGYRYRVTDPWFQHWVITDPRGHTLSATEIDATLPGWFAPLVRHQGVYPEAAPAMQRLAARAEIMILTNLWAEQGEDRRDCLHDAGIDWPMVCWQGSKAPAIEYLQARHPATAFVDDNASHIEDVRKRCPSVRCDHFIADAEIRQLSRQTPAQSASDDWASLERQLSGWLETVSA